MAGRLSGKKAFVTAAAQGIGRATALAFAAEGAEVFATDLNDKLVGEIAGPSIRTAKLDVLSPDAIAAAAQEAGPVDILFNCAGFVHQGNVLEATEEEWAFAFDLNVRSMFRTIRAVLPGMLARGGGSIVNMSSAAGSAKGAPSRFIYGATKASVVGLTKSVAADFVKQGVRLQLHLPRHHRDAEPKRSDRRECVGSGDRWRQRGPRSWRGRRWGAWARPTRSPHWRCICQRMSRSS